MTPIIGARSCTSCRFMVKLPTGALECRFRPPVAQAIMAPGPRGEPVHLGTVAVFPPVSEAMFCFRHERGVVAD